MTHAEALTTALILAITAPDEKKSEMATRLAFDLANTMTDAEVEFCKAQALSRLEMPHV
jgi:hypothetical protein